MTLNGQQNIPVCSACPNQKLKHSNDFFVKRQLKHLPDFIKLNDLELSELEKIQRIDKIPVDEHFTVRAVNVR